MVAKRAVAAANAVILELVFGFAGHQQVGFSVYELRDGGYTVRQLLTVFRLYEVKEAFHDAKMLRQAGVKVEQLQWDKNISYGMFNITTTYTWKWSTRELRDAGYEATWICPNLGSSSAEHVGNNRFAFNTPSKCKHCGYPWQQCEKREQR